MKTLVKDPQIHAIIGAAMEVHRQLGHGFLEAVYQEALALELAERDVPFQRGTNLVIRYKGRALRCENRADFLCFGTVMVELKALAAIVSGHRAQVINELKATGYRVGLLFNFGATSLEYLRFVRSEAAELSADYADFHRLGEEAGEYRVEVHTSDPPSPL